MDYALTLLGHRRYTSCEIKDKLEKKCNREFRENFDEKECRAAITKVLNRLTELKYLDDDEYAADFIANRIKLKPKGRYGLVYELKKKGINPAAVDKYFEENSIHEEEIALKIAREKLGRLNISLPEEKKRSKIIMFLNSRGFNPHIIYEVMDKIFNKI